MRLKPMMLTGLAYLLVALVTFAVLQAFTPVRVLGGSMRPALTNGDLVLVARQRRPGRGDIVLFRTPGRGPVLHRVTQVAPGGSLRTRGDANQFPDAEPVSAEFVKGTVVAVLPVGTAIERWRAR